MVSATIRRRDHSRLVLAAAASSRPCVQVFGTDYPTADGTAFRDDIHVEDLGRAHLLALESIEAEGHRIYNLGNGEGFSVRHVLDAAMAVTGRPIPAVDGLRRPGDPAVRVASGARARRDLGWKPEKPELKAMVADAWANAQRRAS
jgi:UDP-glucose 4-epimerase